MLKVRSTSVGLNGGETSSGAVYDGEDGCPTYIAVKGAALEDKKQQLAPGI